MAKKAKNEGEGEAQVEGEGGESDEPDKRFKKVTFEGQEYKRIDLIRHFCLPTDPELNGGKSGLGWTRSEATAKIRELTGDANFRYQIVFQATKGIKGVKGAARKSAAEASAAPPEGSEGAEASA